MKSRIPISWETLPKKEKDRIVDYCKEVVVNQYEKECQELMKTMVEIAMIVLHEYMSFDKEQLLTFMAMFRMRFPTEEKYVRDNIQKQEHQRLLKEWVGDGDIVRNFFDLIMDKVGNTEFD